MGAGYVWRFRGVAGDHRVNALLERQLAFSRNTEQGSGEARIVGGAHVRKDWTEALIPWTDQRAPSREVDVVDDCHQIPGGEVGPDSARGIGDHQRLNAQTAQNAGRKRHVRRRETLVVTDPT